MHLRMPPCAMMAAGQASYREPGEEKKNFVFFFFV
jgi:hypothetical protein